MDDVLVLCISPLSCLVVARTVAPFLVWREHVTLSCVPRIVCRTKKLDDQARAGDFHLAAGFKGTAVCGEVGSLRGVAVAMRMCVVMHCAMAFWWGSSLRALILRFECEVPLVLLRDCFCVAVLLTY